jgi:arginyl-tRNA--protein-N-Asp/Glu arginylyltransferase
MKEIDFINSRIVYWQERFYTFQEECEHEDQSVVRRVNTMNLVHVFDASQDAYYRDYTCHDCGKKWTVRIPASEYRYA